MIAKKNTLSTSDLAIERLRIPIDAPGVSFTEKQVNEVEIKHLSILEDSPVKSAGCPCGNYFTVHYPPLFENALALGQEKPLTEILVSMLPDRNKPLLVIGIGNDAILSDAIGPRSAMLITATAHTKRNGIAVFSPGTEETSGLSIQSTVSAYVKSFCPRAVIAIDALVTRSHERLLSTIQISDTGIIPGSGIRSTRAGLVKSLLGCPVISIGIPTVIPINIMADKKKINLFLSPNTLDIGVSRGSAIIANAINHLTDTF